MVTIIASTILLSIFFYYENNALDISRITIRKNVSDKIRIIHISDLHSKEFGKNNIKLFNKIINSNPNLIVATGDLIDSNMKNIDKIINFLANLNKEVLVVYIPGNNETRCEKLNYILDQLNQKNVLVLNNEIKTINVGNNKVNILGLVENRVDKGEMFYNKVNSKYLYKDYKELFKSLQSRSGLKLVLSHYPENFEAIGKESYNKYSFDIMFSGHAHGGQFILPFVGGVFAPGQGLRPKYYSGMYGTKNKLIVSRGLGNSGFPIRLFNRPNIVQVDII